VQDSDPPPSAANAAATSPSRGGVISRFAPSPTGHLHLGHAYSAALGHARARESGGKFLLRIEDLDPTRSRPEFVNGIYEDLIWLGLEWDQPMLVQSQRSAVYAEALDRLRAQGLVYACFCTRADIAAALEAPHGPAGAHYPGTCRALPHDPKRRAAMPHCWRLDSVKALEIAGFPEWTEDEGRRFSTGPDDFDDVILARKDAPAAYHLACVVDDAATGVTLVVRAADLRTSTPIQRLLQTLLGFPEPTYAHHPLVAHADGGRLAKRDRAPTLAALRENGVNGPGLAVDLLDGKLPLGFAFVDA
jgi:glutamyl-Q tRNA(Asp) synthetase